MDKIAIDPTDSMFSMWYDEAVVPEATEEEKERIRPYVLLLQPSITEYIIQKSPWRKPASVKLHVETFAHIFFHTDKTVQMKLNIASDMSVKEYPFLCDFSEYVERHKHLIQTIDNAIARDKQRQMKKRQAAIQQKQKRIERYKKIAESLQTLSSMQMQRVQKIEQALDKIQEAMQSIALVQEQAERVHLQRLMYEKTMQIEQARAERRQAEEQVRKLEQEKGMLQTAKKLLQETKEIAKGMINKAVEGAKSIGKAIKGFFSKGDSAGDKGKTDSSSDKGKGHDAGGPDL